MYEMSGFRLRLIPKKGRVKHKKKANFDDYECETDAAFLGSIISINTSSESSGSSEDEVAEILQELVATARTHGKNRELDEAFECCAKIKEILIKHGQSLSHKKLLAETFFRMALVYDSSDEKMSHFSESLAMFQHCKEHEERAGFEEGMIQSHLAMIDCMIHISELLIVKNQIDDSLNMAEQAIRALSQVQSKSNDMGLVAMKAKLRCILNAIRDGSD